MSTLPLKTYVSLMVIFICHGLSSKLTAQCVASFTHYISGNTVHFYSQSGPRNARHHWSFGDGTTSSLTGLTHTYSTFGTYNVCLIITSTSSVGGLCTDTTCKTITISACKAKFTDSVSANQVWFKNQSQGSVGYRWTFGDGGSSNAINPRHSYSKSGTYVACLYSLDSVGVCDSFCDTIVTSLPSGSCKVFFISKSNLLKTSFTNHSTVSNASYQWDFGDSSTSFLLNPKHTYTASGTYKVCLYGLDSGTVCDSFCDSVSVSSIAVCKASFYSSSNNLTAHFTNRSAGRGLSYEWNFGDGDTSTLENPSHRYTSAGKYSVCLVVTDSAGTCTDTFCDSTYVFIPPTCKVNFKSKSNGLKASFNNFSQAGQPTYEWIFGDGSTSTLSNPHHTYAKSGAYWVCLILKDSGQLCDTFCDFVVVSALNTCKALYSSQSSGLTVNFQSKSSGSTLSHYWDFDDGSTSRQVSPSYTYSSAGSYLVCLIVNDTTGNCADAVCDSIVVKKPKVCQALYTSHSSGLITAFTNLSNTQNASYLWEFGDGDTSTAISPSHTYQSSGSYNVCLFAIDSGTVCDTFCDSVIVSNCQASFLANSNGLTVRFTTDSLPSGLLYSWDFGDGTSSTAKNPTHIYPHAGRFVTCLTINDSSNNCRDTFCDTVNASSTYTCSASFLYSVTGLSVSLSNTSTEHSGTTYKWNFGDGDTSTQKSPTHVYSGAGKYLACLNVLDSGLVCDSMCDSINVGAPVSINNLQETALRVFPNPFRDEFVVTSAKGEIESFRVLDLTGKEQLMSISSASSSAITIDASNLPAGIYILQVSVDNQIESRRLIKH